MHGGWYDEATNPTSTVPLRILYGRDTEGEVVKIEVLYTDVVPWRNDGHRLVGWRQPMVGACRGAYRPTANADLYITSVFRLIHAADIAWTEISFDISLIDDISEIKPDVLARTIFRQIGCVKTHGAVLPGYKQLQKHEWVR